MFQEKVETSSSSKKLAQTFSLREWQWRVRNRPFISASWLRYASEWYWDDWWTDWARETVFQYNGSNWCFR
jgi:hypothetical protein